jgi:hypothetical protein
MEMEGRKVNLMITEEKKQVCENVLSTSKNISPKSDSR